MSKLKNYVQLELFNFDKLKNPQILSEMNYSYGTEIEYNWCHAPYESVSLDELNDFFSSIPDIDLTLGEFAENSKTIVEYATQSTLEADILKNELAELTKTLYAQYTRVKDLNALVDELKQQLEQQSKK